LDQRFTQPFTTDRILEHAASHDESAGANGGAEPKSKRNRELRRPTTRNLIGFATTNDSGRPAIAEPNSALTILIG
jgi:hypothetical protein